jgi:hypothetical protein
MFLNKQTKKSAQEKFTSDRVETWNGKAGHHITVLCDERVVRRAEVDEPVPASVQAQEHGDGVQRGGQHRRAAVRHEVGPTDDPNVPGARVHGAPGHQLRQPAVLLRGGLPVQVQQVGVSRVVQSRQQPRGAAGVPRRRGDEVRERHRALGAGGQEGPAAAAGARDEERREEQDGADQERREGGGHC